MLRKSQMCQCGCLGWCTISPVLRFLAWSFTALAAGRMPQARHNGQAFAPAEDSDRKAKAGQPLLKALLVHLKGDWSEFCHTLGFPAWNSTLDPCFCCHATQDEMRKLGAFSVLHPPFPEKDQVAYEEACAACEVWVELKSKAQHQVVLGSLFYDKRKRGSKGRSLSRDIPALKLLQGDRLEPSKSLERGPFRRLGATVHGALLAARQPDTDPAQKSPFLQRDQRRSWHPVTGHLAHTPPGSVPGFLPDRPVGPDPGRRVER